MAAGKAATLIDQQVAATVGGLKFTECIG